MRGNVLKEHQDLLHAAGGHVEVDIPKGVALVSGNFSVPQNPVIEDRKAAVVLIAIMRASSGCVTISYSRLMFSMSYEALASSVARFARL